MRLSADDYVVAAFHHKARPAAMLIRVPDPVGLQVVDENRLAALRRNPQVRTAAFEMNAHVADAQRRPAIHSHIRRSGFRRSNANVRALDPVVIVRGNQRTISQARLFGGHTSSSNITRKFRERTSWR